jgi:hypothetical protein
VWAPEYLSPVTRGRSRRRAYHAPVSEAAARDDGCAVVTEDSAQAHHTVAITATGPQISITAG